MTKEQLIAQHLTMKAELDLLRGFVLHLFAEKHGLDLEKLSSYYAGKIQEPLESDILSFDWKEIDDLMKGL